MRINFCAEGASCGEADIDSLQSQGKTSCNFGDATERIRIGEVANVSGKRIDFRKGKNLAECRARFEKEIGSIAVVGFKEFFELRERLDDSGRVGVGQGSASGGSVRGKSGVNGGNGQAERAGKGFESGDDGVIGSDSRFGSGSNFGEGVSAEIG